MGVAIVPDGSDTDVKKALDLALPLPPDSHEMRGTFARDIYVENDPWDFAKGPAALSIGNSIPFQKGMGEMSRVERENTVTTVSLTILPSAAKGKDGTTSTSMPREAYTWGHSRLARMRNFSVPTGPMENWVAVGLETAPKTITFPAAPGKRGKICISDSFRPEPPIFPSGSFWFRKKIINNRAKSCIMNKKV